ncbi:MAG: hypothetical protein ACTSPA_07095, partial [Promethearchaeota archaeon]
NQSNLDKPADSNMELLSEQISHNLSDMSLIFKKIQKSLTEDYQSELFLDIKNLSKHSVVKEIGINLLKNKILEKPIESESIVFAIQKKYWDALLPRVIKSTKFNSALENLNIFHFEIINEKIMEELKNIPIEIDSSVREDYKKAYYRNPLTFSEYLNIEQKKHKERQFSLDQPDSFDSSEKLRKEFVQAIEKKKLDKKKEDQKKSFDNYNAYFEMDDRELKRAKRNGKMKRKYTKKTRRNKR